MKQYIVKEFWSYLLDVALYSTINLTYCSYTITAENVLVS